MIRNLVLMAIFAGGGLLHGPAPAQKVVIAPEMESLVKAQAQEAIKTSLRIDAGARRSSVTSSPKAAIEPTPDHDNLRMLVVALILMVAIAIRRNRSDPR